METLTYLVAAAMMAVIGLLIDKMFPK